MAELTSQILIGVAMLLGPTSLYIAAKLIYDYKALQDCNKALQKSYGNLIAATDQAAALYLLEIKRLTALRDPLDPNADRAPDPKRFVFVQGANGGESYMAPGAGGGIGGGSDVTHYDVECLENPVPGKEAKK